MKLKRWGALCLLLALQGCASYEGSETRHSFPASHTGWRPVSSYDIPPGGLAPEIGYDAEVVSCLQECQKTNRELSSVGLDNLRQCGCDCLSGHSPWHEKFCRSVEGGLLQSYNADSLMDLKSKGNNH